MQLSTLDWVIIFGYLVLTIAVGLSYTKQASKNIESFFLGGRNMPWLLAGLSMVATTFAADTPLAVAEIVSKDGIAGNWVWWSFLAGGMLTTFFFARLWQRSGVLTEVELIELRYSGKPAQFLRGFKAIYLGVFMNAIIVAWVNVALQTLLMVFFDLSPGVALALTAVIMVLTAIYSSFSGLMGVAVTDALQFVIAMAGCIVLAYFVVVSPEIGGIEGLKNALTEQNPNILNFLPSLEGTESSIGTTLGLSFAGFFAYAGMQWWACWYPGAEPGGGGYIAQRMMSTRSDKDAVYATLFFQIAHYCIRPWAWIIVGLAAVVLYPDLPVGDERLGYAYAMRDFLPVGWRGLLLVAFLAAYMSTISTQLNWGAGYLVNDVYKRFIAPDKEEKDYVWAARAATVLMMVLGLIVSTFVESISGAWKFIMQAGAGLGLVLILRWYWWRINAWSEIAATIAPFVITPFMYMNKVAFAPAIIITTIFTTAVWVFVTLSTKPEPDSTLNPFWERVHGAKEGEYKVFSPAFAKHLKYLGACWGSAIVMTYSILFLTGKFILQEYGTAFFLALIAGTAFYFLNWFMQKAGLIGDGKMLLEETLDDNSEEELDENAAKTNRYTNVGFGIKDGLEEKDQDIPAKDISKKINAPKTLSLDITNEPEDEIEEEDEEEEEIIDSVEDSDDLEEEEDEIIEEEQPPKNTKKDEPKDGIIRIGLDDDDDF